MGSPVIYHSKEFVCDSGGAGQYRGGLGQQIEIGSRINEDMFMSAAAFERLTSGPEGRQNGKRGANGEVSITDGTRVTDKGMYRIPAGERVILKTPGGGGYGDPSARDRTLLDQDVENGLVSQHAAQKIYTAE